MKDSAVVQDKTQNGSIFVCIQSVLAVIVSWYLTFFTFAALTLLVFLGAIALAEIQKNKANFYR